MRPSTAKFMTAASQSLSTYTLLFCNNRSSVSNKTHLRLNCSGMWHRGIWWTGTNTSKDIYASIFTTKLNMEAAGSSEIFVPTTEVHDVTSEKSLILSVCQQPSDFPCSKFSAPYLNSTACESGRVGVVCSRYKSLKRLEVSFISRSKVVSPLHRT